ncbi:MAG TPA: hypothetical protein VFK05_11445 [Polyangiaceae bacterium]|nr:hypothetical protein [Polyangiaceae bacterium]
MSIGVDDAERRLRALLGLSEQQAARAVDEVFDVLRLDVDEFIAARHAQLQAQGEQNPVIFERIARELSRLRFKAPALSTRQIRRRIYG